jgi:mono/diheme cytochrome c family protein
VVVESIDEPERGCEQLQRAGYMRFDGDWREIPWTPDVPQSENTLAVRRKRALSAFYPELIHGAGSSREQLFAFSVDHRMRRKRLVGWIVGAAAGGAVIAAAVFWIITQPKPAFADAEVAALERPGDPAHGRMIFAAGDCASCHARPGQSDRLNLGGGLALASPFGTLRVPNISPDPKDGIGKWRTIDLANALMSGVSPAGQHYYPALPYASFVHMTVDDVRDLMAYLRTLPPVSGRAPPHELKFPFTVRRFIGLWKFLYFDRSPLSAEGTPAVRRGRYLAEALSHCAECHSTRDVFGGIKPATRLAGGPDPEGTGFVPNITPSRIGDRSDSQIVALLRTGRTPAGNQIGSSMLSVVSNLAVLPEDDVKAIAAYLKTVPPRDTPHP